MNAVKMKNAMKLLAIGSASAALAGCATIADTVGESFNTALVGAQEVPGPGDPDGTGTAKIVADATTNRICFDLTVQQIAPATAAHIHRGARGVSGPPVLTLDAPVNGASSDCLKVDKALAASIIANPSNFYVNVHNSAYPAGAVRGQLQ